MRHNFLHEKVNDHEMRACMVYCIILCQRWNFPSFHPDPLLPFLIDRNSFSSNSLEIITHDESFLPLNYHLIDKRRVSIRIHPKKSTWMDWCRTLLREKEMIFLKIGMSNSWSKMFGVIVENSDRKVHFTNEFPFWNLNHYTDFQLETFQCKRWIRLLMLICSKGWWVMKNCLLFSWNRNQTERNRHIQWGLCPPTGSFVWGK